MKKRGSRIFFTSDLHFGHLNVINYCNRPFKSVQEMDETLIKNWNKVVSPVDKVYVLGDFFMYHKKDTLRNILAQLNGTKILIKGNHDMSDREMESIGFSAVFRNAVMVIAGEQVNLSHYPYKKPKHKELYWTYLHKLFPKRFYKPRVFSDQLRDDGKFLLHGHTHSKNKVFKKQIHVGVDAWDFKPIPLGTIADMIGKIKNNIEIKQ